MIKFRLAKRIEVLEKAADLKGFIPVLFVEKHMDEKMKRPDFAQRITMEEYEAGNLPRGVTEQTVIIIDDIGRKSFENRIV